MNPAVKQTSIPVGASDTPHENPLVHVQDELCTKIRRFCSSDTKSEDEQEVFISDAIDATYKLTAIDSTGNSPVAYLHSALFSALTTIVKNPSLNEIDFIDTLSEAIFTNPAQEVLLAQETTDFMVAVLDKVIEYTKLGQDKPREYDLAEKLLGVFNQYLETLATSQATIPNAIDMKILDQLQLLRELYSTADALYNISNGQDSAEGSILFETFEMVKYSRNQRLAPEILFFCNELSNAEERCIARKIKRNDAFFFTELRADCYTYLSLCRSHTGIVTAFWVSTLAVFPAISEEWQCAFNALARIEPPAIDKYVTKLVNAIIKQHDKKYACDHGGLIEFLELDIGISFLLSKFKTIPEFTARKLLQRLDNYLTINSSTSAIICDEECLAHLFPLTSKQREAIETIRAELTKKIEIYE